MKNSYKIALLAALGLASVTVAQAQNDLIVGVYQAGDANTAAYDLGLVGIPSTGETWNLSSTLSAAGITSLSSTAVFGVVGDNDLGTGKSGQSVYVTDVGTPNKINGSSAWDNVDTAISSIALGTAAVGNPNGNDWASETSVNVSGSVAAGLGENISGSVSSQIDLWTVSATDTTPVLDGYFTLNTSDDVLTYTASAVPEPTTYGLLAGAGLLIVSLRNKFSRKQA